MPACFVIKYKERTVQRLEVYIESIFYICVSGVNSSTIFHSLFGVLWGYARNQSVARFPSLHPAIHTRGQALAVLFPSWSDPCTS